MLNRIKKVIEYSGLSDRAFALKCGMNQPTLFNQLKGLRQVSLDTTRNIIKTFPEINAEWLLTGEGEMLKKLSSGHDIDRIATLVDTIATLNAVISDKDATIAALKEQIKLLNNQIK